VFAVGRAGIAGFLGQDSQLGYLASRYWSPSVLWTVDLVVVLAGVICAFRTEFRDQFSIWRHLLVPAAAAEAAGARGAIRPGALVPWTG
jgi:hypothetical protein